jgi:hypothetical protein
MALPRQPWKLPLKRARKYLFSAALLLAWPLGNGVAGVSERIVADHYTGLAIAGYDPVAYFVNGRPMEGRPNYEYTFAQGAFRFRNEGNMAAFAARPDVYIPQFGGYDATALTRGVALAGNPLEWLIVENRLYLFYSPQAKAAFIANPQAAITAATERWPQVLHELIP